MNRLIAVSLLSLGLAACGPSSDPGAAAPASPTASTDTAAPAVAETPAAQPAPKGRKLRQALPNDVVLPFAYHARTDRVVQTPRGDYQRRVNVELLEGDAASTTDALIAAMRKGGYRPGKPTTRADGSIRVAFSHKQTGRVVAVVSNQLPAKPVNAAARGKLLLVLPADAPSA
jgi:hypothetical protein